MYSAALDTPANRKFVADYRKKYGKVPSYFSETCYTSARWINEAAKLVGGNVEEREKFMAAFRKVEIPDAPRGPVKLDQWGNPIQNIYVRKVERKGGELQNTVIHTFPARLAVLDLQAGGVPEAAGVQPRLPALQGLLGARRMLTRIDHVMICVPDLAKGIEAYTRLGFTVYPGGSHTGRPTHNAIAFHDEDYLEILSIRDRQRGRPRQPGREPRRVPGPGRRLPDRVDAERRPGRGRGRDAEPRRGRGRDPRRRAAHAWRARSCAGAPRSSARGMPCRSSSSST